MKSTLVIIDGQNGAGKTTVARLLHQKLPSTALIHWDTLKKLISNFKPNKEHHAIVAEVAQAMARVYLKNGVSVICEAYFGRGEYIHTLIKKQKGVRVLVYQIEAPFQVRAQRIKERYRKGEKKRWLTQAKLKLNDVTYHTNKYTKARAFDSSKYTAIQISKQIIQEIKAKI